MLATMHTASDTSWSNSEWCEASDKSRLRFASQLLGDCVQPCKTMSGM